MILLLLIFWFRNTTHTVRRLMLNHVILLPVKKKLYYYAIWVSKFRLHTVDWILFYQLDTFTSIYKSPHHFLWYTESIKWPNITCLNYLLICPQLPPGAKSFPRDMDCFNSFFPKAHVHKRWLLITLWSTLKNLNICLLHSLIF